MDYIKFPNNKHRGGSVLILVVVLTALLAAVGTIFLLSSRVESMSTSAIAETKALNSAIDSIVKKISNELINDVPGVSGQEYYDYPGDNDTWLASIEPYKKETAVIGTFEYIWPQITDLTGLLQNQDDPAMRFATQHVKVDPPGTRTVILEYPEIELNSDGTWLDSGNTDDGENGTEYRGQLADADGDGIADAKWIKLTDISTSKGKDIYAAIRIIDNGGMINVNTSYQFDPTTVTFNAAADEEKEVDGSTQLNIDLRQLVYSGDTIDDLILELCDMANIYNSSDYDDYLRDALWRIESPAFESYHQFDTADELGLRNRFCVDPNDQGRLRNTWEDTLDLRYKKFDSTGGNGLSDWRFEVCRNIVAPMTTFTNEYDRRHMLTCWNMDRIINPDGIDTGGSLEDCRMFGVNGRVLNNSGDFDQSYYDDLGNRQDLYKAIKAALTTTMTDTVEAISTKAAQITVNLIDYVDEDLRITMDNVQRLDTTLALDQDVYGFDGPCVYISEIAARREAIPADPADPQYSYAIELYNPYASADESLATLPKDNWYLQINGATPGIAINWVGSDKFHVMHNENPGAPITGFIDTSAASELDYPSISFSQNNTISIAREVDNGIGGTAFKVVDSMTVPAGVINPVSAGIYTVKRDMRLHYCIKNIWSAAALQQESLGEDNNYDSGNTDAIQAHSSNRKLDCIGDIGNIFAEDAYDSIKALTTEDSVKINLANPIYQNLFQYLTVFDPYNDRVDNDGDDSTDRNDQNKPEFKIPGRININTAPWFVLAQLPWVSKETSGAINYELSKAIVAYRDKIKIDDADYYNGGDPSSRYNTIASKLYGATTANISEDKGFRSIGELNFVADDSVDDLYSMRKFALDNTDLLDYPDVIKIDTDGDGIVEAIDGLADDFEERDVIFARMSNLVTVRSDVFTAYILVRVGVDGPQQRAIAILDRSDVYPNPNPLPNTKKYIGDVKIKALQMMPDAR